MSWTIGGVRWYVQKATQADSKIMPRLQPISGGTVLQSFGYESEIRNVSAIVVGDTNKNAIKAFAKDGLTAHAFVSPEGSLGNWIVKSFQADRTDSTCQTIDQTQPEDAPVYEVEAELQLED